MEPFLFKHEDKLYQVKTFEGSGDIGECCNFCALFNVCNERLVIDCEYYLNQDQYLVEYENQQIQINNPSKGSRVSYLQRERRR